MKARKGLLQIDMLDYPLNVMEQDALTVNFKMKPGLIHIPCKILGIEWRIIYTEEDKCK